MPREILATGTGAASSEAFVVGPGDTVTVEFIGTPGASDKIHIQYFDGASWYNIKEGGADRDLDFNNNLQRITGPVRARVDRTGTTASVGAALATRAIP